jgi:hypothetical protein
MKNKIRGYVYFTDAGHGWLRVKKTELEALGIADQITPYSYQYNNWAYLEEDRDMSTFFKAKGWDYWPNTIKQVCSNYSKIRSYQCYQK